MSRTCSTCIYHNGDEHTHVHKHHDTGETIIDHWESSCLLAKPWFDAADTEIRTECDAWKPEFDVIS